MTTSDVGPERSSVHSAQRTHTRRLRTETKASFKTTELLAYVPASSR